MGPTTPAGGQPACGTVTAVHAATASSAPRSTAPTPMPPGTGTGTGTGTEAEFRAVGRANG